MSSATIFLVVIGNLLSSSKGVYAKPLYRFSYYTKRHLLSVPIPPDDFKMPDFVAVIVGGGDFFSCLVTGFGGLSGA
jgi:hypothetical protein